VVDSPAARKVSVEDGGEGGLPHLQAESMSSKNEGAKRLGFRATKAGVVEFWEREVERLGR
jgi:hypothetical protein